jgi:hypothetical protein
MNHIVDLCFCGGLPPDLTKLGLQADPRALPRSPPHSGQVKPPHRYPADGGIVHMNSVALTAPPSAGY